MLPVSLAAMVLVRPEGVLFVGLVLLAISIRDRHPRHAISAGLCCAVLVLPVFLAERIVYGFWLPNTYYIKSGLGFAKARQGAEYLWGSRPRYGVVAGAFVLVNVAAVIRGRLSAWSSAWPESHA